MKFKTWLESLRETNPNYSRISQIISIVKRFAQQNPDDCERIIQDIEYGNTKVYIVGGSADPSRNQNLRNDMDVLFSRQFDMSDAVMSIAKLQSNLVVGNLHGQFNTLDASKPHIDITNQIVDALKSAI